MLALPMTAGAQTADWRFAHVGELLFTYFMIACVSTGVNDEHSQRLYESVGFRVVNQYLEYAKAG